MKKIILNTLILSLILSYSYGQKIYEIYQDDSVQIFFKVLGKENGFYYDVNNIKDSLPDGIYKLFDVNRKDSLSKKKNIILSGQYVNYRKTDRFERNQYVYNKKEKTYKLSYQHFCNYKDGKKNGIEEEYNVCPFFNPSKVMIFHGEYFEDKKQGLFMYFELGSPIKIESYENNAIKQVLFDISK